MNEKKKTAKCKPFEIKMVNKIKLNEKRSRSGNRFTMPFLMNSNIEQPRTTPDLTDW